MKPISKRIDRIIILSKKEWWEDDIPLVRANLRLAINSLHSQLPFFWEKKPEEIARVIKSNKGIRKILNQ